MNSEKTGITYEDLLREVLRRQHYSNDDINATLLAIAAALNGGSYTNDMVYAILHLDRAEPEKVGNMPSRAHEIMEKFKFVQDSTQNVINPLEFFDN